MIVSLQITAIGMGLVFASILLLWAVMAVLVRLTAAPNEIDAPAGPEAVRAREYEKKQKAAALAVAVALAHDSESGPHTFPLPPTAFVSAWQAVRRANQLQRRGKVR